MKYYSEKTKKLYDTIEDFNAGELEYDKAHAAELKKAEERKADAKAIDEAYAKCVEDAKHYNDLIRAFIKKYGKYHRTISGSDNLTSLLNDFFSFLD